MLYVRGRHDSACPVVPVALCCNICRSCPCYIHVLIVIQQFFFLIFLSSSRSDQMLEDIIFKLVPGLQESEPLFLIACVCFYTFTEPVVLTTLSSLVSFFSTLPPAVHMYDSFYMCSIINTLFPRRLIFSIKHFCFRLIIPVPIVVTNFPFGKFWYRCIMSKLFVNTTPLLSTRLPFGSSKFTRFEAFCVSIYDKRS